MKRFVAILVIIAILVTVLCGCGRKRDKKDQETPDPKVTAPVATDNPIPTPVATSDPTPTVIPIPTPPTPNVTTPPKAENWTASSVYMVTDKIKTMFDKTMEGFIGAAYFPFAFLGSSKDADGTEYAVLCGALEALPDAKPYYALVYIFEDAEGIPRITDIQNLTPGGELMKERVYSEPLVGGWSVSFDSESGMDAFEKATERVMDTVFIPIHVLGEQVVAGSNFCVLCQCRTKGNEMPFYALVYVHKDFSGNATISKTTKLSASGKPVPDPLKAG